MSIESAQQCQLEGNSLFGCNSFRAAMRKYFQALNICDESGDSSSEYVKLRLSCHLNVAACALKLYDYYLAIEHGSRALKLDDSNVKALFRRGSALFRINQLEEAARDLMKASTLDPGNVVVKTELDLLRQVVLSNGTVRPPATPQPATRDLPPLPQYVVDSLARGICPRVPFNHPDALDIMHHEVPVILEGSHIADVALRKWWDLEYLQQHIGSRNDFTVFTSPTKNFRYYDESKNLGGYHYTSQNVKQPMSFDNFVQLMKQNEHDYVSRRASADYCAPLADVHAQQLPARASMDAITSSAVPAMQIAPQREVDQLLQAVLATRAPSPHSHQFYYLQQMLHDTVGAQIVQDFKSFHWDWVHSLATSLGFGKIKFNTLWIGEPTVTTPAHFDEAYNLYLQVRGRKNFTLFAPAQFGCLYPFPYHHPCDRQSQVNLDAPDLTAFPRFAEAHPIVCCCFVGIPFAFPAGFPLCVLLTIFCLGMCVASVSKSWRCAVPASNVVASRGFVGSDRVD
eukprot:TRINITY_DN6473_c0_g1_i1.p1 TRINITY_DN6473_c0_g1~~TRINITY_DN6473_c0_g1_i1.p1  ORF type:complete len:512 (+),score=93.01 TRINITY_DN6473_c0_g1_i1:66-1601(+)